MTEDDAIDQAQSSLDRMAAAVATPVPPLPIPVAANAIHTITADGAQYNSQAPNDVINDPTASNDIIFSYQGGDSHTQITVGTGLNNTITAHTFDTVTVSAANGTIGEFQGHDNVFNLGDGNYKITLGANDTLTTGNGNSTIGFYTGATNDTLT